MTTVSGRVYTRTRPRGFAEWAPRAATLDLLDQVKAVLHENREYLPMTARQVFYRLVGAFGYDKTEKAYDRLTETLNRARRARLIDMHAIRDDGGSVSAPFGYDGPESYWDSVRGGARYYCRALDAYQPTAVELWVEAAGMVPMVARVAHDYGVTVYSSGGFDSVTAKYGAAMRITRREVATRVLHVGDYDPSGLSILDSAAEDVAAFARDDLVRELTDGYSELTRQEILDGHRQPTFTRLAVTPEQIREHRLPSAPQKGTDRRGEHMHATVQAEALSPTQLLDAVRTGIEAVVDLAVLAEVREQGEREREEILQRLEDLAI